MGYKRAQQESFAYCHTVKNGSVAAIQEQARVRVEQEQQRWQEQHQVQEHEQQRRGIGCQGRKGLGISFIYSLSPLT